jgi:hypothetical protein
MTSSSLNELQSYIVKLGEEKVRSPASCNSCNCATYVTLSCMI